MLYEIISLYELFIYIGLIFLTSLTQNTYTLSVLLMIVLKFIPERTLKHFSPASINNRPKDSFDCNLINRGGSFKDKTGFPSGHSTVSGFVMMYVLLLFIQVHKKTGKYLTILLLWAIVFGIAVPFARAKSHCHTIPQVLGGTLLGFLWGILFFTIEEKYLLNIDRYKTDRDAIINYMLSNQ